MSLYSKLCLNINLSERHARTIHPKIAHFPCPVTHSTFFMLYYCFLHLWAFGIILYMFVYSLIVCLPSVSSMRAETLFFSPRQPKRTHHILHVASVTNSECRSLSVFSSYGSDSRQEVWEKTPMSLKNLLCLRLINFVNTRVLIYSASLILYNYLFPF